MVISYDFMNESACHVEATQIMWGEMWADENLKVLSQI